LLNISTDKITFNSRVTSNWTLGFLFWLPCGAVEFFNDSIARPGQHRPKKKKSMNLNDKHGDSYAADRSSNTFGKSCSQQKKKRLIIEVGLFGAGLPVIRTIDVKLDLYHKNSI
jgi:hypothetical protein